MRQRGDPGASRFRRPFLNRRRKIPLEEKVFLSHAVIGKRAAAGPSAGEPLKPRKRKRKPCRVSRLPWRCPPGWSRGPRFPLPPGDRRYCGHPGVTAGSGILPWAVRLRAKVRAGRPTVPPYGPGAHPAPSLPALPGQRHRLAAGSPDSTGWLVSALYAPACLRCRTAGVLPAHFRQRFSLTGQARCQYTAPGRRSTRHSSEFQEARWPSPDQSPRPAACGG